MILTSYPGRDSRDDHWERCLFQILEFTKGMNSGVLIISGKGWPTGYHAPRQKNIRVFQLSAKANFPKNGCKIGKFLSHTLKALFI